MEQHDTDVTFEQLCEHEPRLRTLEQEIQNLQADSPHWCANNVWYRDFEGRFNFLVGWHAVNPVLNSEVAYNVAFGHLYGLMPPCKDCACL